MIKEIKKNPPLAFFSLGQKSEKTAYLISTLTYTNNILIGANRGYNQPVPLWGFEGDFSGHPIYVLTYVLTFGAGQKNNQCHGPVALVTMAPLYIIYYFPYL